MLCSSSEGFCLDELLGSILFNAGPLIFAVVVRNWGGLGGCREVSWPMGLIFLRGEIFWDSIN